jgi:hypothetical protein
MTSSLYGETIFGNEKKSKYAAFYTIHNALDELELNIKFFNRSEFLCKNFDVIINCNGSESPRLRKLASRFNCNRTVLLFDSKNEGGHYMGPPEQIANTFEYLEGYDLVLHLHADVYIVSDHGLKKLTEEYEANVNDRCDFYVFPLPEREKQYAFDAWLFHPSEKSKAFKDWSEYVINPRPGIVAHAEPYLWDLIHENGMTAGLFDRGPCAAMQLSYEKNSGLIDTIYIDVARNIFENGVRDV